MTYVVEFIRSITDGGAETLVKDYSLLINKKEFNVIVICLSANHDSANYKLLRSHGIYVVEIYNTWNYQMKIFNYVFGQYFVSRFLKKFLKKNKVNTVHAHVGVLKYLSPIRKEIKKLNIKVLYTCHNLPQRYFGKGQKREKNACRLLLKENNLQLIALHSDMAHELNEMFHINNVAVINNGIDFKRFELINETKEEIRDSLGIPKNAYVIGNIGKFSRQKNHKFILEVFAKIKDMDKNAFLLLIGAGELEIQINDKIEALGLKDKVMILSYRDDIPRVLKSMDCFFFPSLFEGLGIVAVEAQKAGIKTVLADTVPNSAYLSSNLIVMSLDDSIDRWVQAILYEIPNYVEHGNIEEWDMNLIIKQIEVLYENKIVI